MKINERIMNDAMTIRTSIEYAIRNIFDIPQDRQNIGTNINRLKKSFGISEEQQNIIKKVWKTSSEILHLNQKENLKDNDKEKVLNILRNIMTQSSDEKKEYLLNGLIYYKLIFDKSKNVIDKFEHRDEDSDIFILKEYYNSLNNQPQKIDCMILPKNENQFTEYISLSLKESFDVNQLFICSKTIYDNLHNKNINEDCIDLLINLEKGEKIQDYKIEQNNTFKEYKSKNGLTYYRLDEVNEDNMYFQHETHFILKEHFNAFQNDNYRIAIKLEYSPNIDTIENIELIDSSYHFVKKIENNQMCIGGVESGNYLIYDNDERSYKLFEVV